MRPGPRSWRGLLKFLLDFRLRFRDPVVRGLKFRPPLETRILDGLTFSNRGVMMTTSEEEVITLGIELELRMLC